MLDGWESHRARQAIERELGHVHFVSAGERICLDYAKDAADVILPHTMTPREVAVWLARKIGEAER